MFSWFRKKTVTENISHLTTDVHSHLLPGLDDGVKSFEQSRDIILHFKSLGYKKIITTPHVMFDHYRNTTEGILGKLEELKNYLQENNIEIEIQAAAEYYLDEHLIKNIETNQRILTFGDRYLLFETNFLSEPLNLKEFIFLAITRGYKPVLAHPERYVYLQNNMDKVLDLLNRGVLFQINIGSIAGHYSKGIQLTAQKLITQGHVHFLGSDCHHMLHAELIQKAHRSRYFQKALTLPLLNNNL